LQKGNVSKMFAHLIRVIYVTIFFLGLTGCARQSDEYQGYIEGDLTFIASPFSGVLEELHVKEGDTVQKGQSLIFLELEPQQSQYQQASFQLQSAQKTLDNLKKGERQTIVVGIEAEIGKAQSELELAKVRLDRTQKLYESKLTDKDNLDQATTEFNTKRDALKQLSAKLEEAKLGGREDVIAAQEALVEAAQARVKELDWALASKKLNAPDDGYIYDIFYRQGEFIPASKPILSLLTPLNQFVVFYVPVEKMPRIQVGQKIQIDCEGCQKKYGATLSYISPKVEYTPPVIFSREHQHKYVYRLHAKLEKEAVKMFHLGQPVYVNLVQGNP